MSTCKKKVSPRTFEYLRRWLTRTTVAPPPPPLPAAASPAPSPSFVPGWPSPRRPGTLPRRLAGATRGSPPPARWGRVRNPESVLRINYLSPHFTTVQEIQMENWTEEVMKFLWDNPASGTAWGGGGLLLWTATRLPGTWSSGTPSAEPTGGLNGTGPPMVSRKVSLYQVRQAPFTFSGRSHARVSSLNTNPTVQPLRRASILSMQM